MTKEEMSVLIKAIAVYGTTIQKAVAIEEMSELTKEICKDTRGMLNIEHISEEIADVEIMINQLKVIYCVGEKTESYIKSKIKRLEERINEPVPGVLNQ